MLPLKTVPCVLADLSTGARISLSNFTCRVPFSLFRRLWGAVARTGVEGFILGNTADTILRQTACSVLAVEPPAFVTPVTREGRSGMQGFFASVALFLLLNLGAGMWRVLRGPSAADRMLATQLFGTTAVAIVLLLAEATGSAALRDVALVFALLATVAAVAFVRRAWPDSGDDDDPE